MFFLFLEDLGCMVKVNFTFFNICIIFFFSYYRLFLDRLRIYGKGNWKNISKYLKSRTPTQVANHAQKYFIHQNAYADKKRKKSILYITLDKRRDST